MTEKKNIKIETDLKLTEPEAEAPNKPAPLYEITQEMAGVALGKSVGNLRELVSSLLPADKTEAEKFVSQMLRLRQSAEAAHQAATEAFSTLKA